MKSALYKIKIFCHFICIYTALNLPSCKEPCDDKGCSGCGSTSECMACEANNGKGSMTCDAANKCQTDNGQIPSWPKPGDSNYKLADPCKVTPVGPTSCTSVTSGTGSWCTTDPNPKCDNYALPDPSKCTTPHSVNCQDGGYSGGVGDPKWDIGCPPADCTGGSGSTQIYCPGKTTETAK